MKKTVFIFASILWLGVSTFCRAQIFSDDRWEEKTLILGKWSQLYYGLDVGFNVSDYEYSADFIYFDLGYGKPTTKNAWRKFLPNSQQAAPDSKEEMQKRTDDTTSGLHAGTIGIGWLHYFNHVIGFHVQAGWGFIADFGSGNSSSSSSGSSSSSSEEETKKTFIYNTIPVQAGVDVNLWNNINVQVGATYLWKEIPIITVGLGATF